MRSSYKRIGSFVKQVNIRNKDLSVTNLQGININKFFMPSVANTNGTDLSKYKVVAQKQFAFNPMHVGRDEVLPISMLEEEDSVIVSPAYVVFKVKDETQLLPEYLMMWCRRPEFDRNAWFTTDSSVRGGFNWKDFCDLTLPVPTIEKQREIVREYHTIVDRIKLNEQLNQKLEETAQAIYKQWFVDFEFLCLPENYKFSGADKPSDFNSIMTYSRVGGLPVPDGNSWFVYVLLCRPSSEDEQASDDYSFYKGITNDLYRRFYEHYTGIGADYTKAHKPQKVVHWERFDTQEEAASREKELKSGYGRTWLQRQWAKSGLSAPKGKAGGSPAPECQLRMAGKMVWNDELDQEIPEGWDIRRIGDIATLKYGKMLDASLFEDKGFPVFSGYGIRGYFHSYMYEEPQILVLCRGVSGTGEVRMSPAYSYITNLSIIVQIDESIISKSFAFYYLKNDNLRKLDSGSAQSQITSGDLGNHNILVPSYTYQKSFDSMISQLQHYSSNIDAACLTLSKFNQVLLSKITKADLSVPVRKTEATA